MLKGTVASAGKDGASLIVMGHIAPGASHVDWQSMAASGWSGGGWTSAAQEQLYSLLRAEAARPQRSPLVGLVFGHLHTGSVRLLPPPRGGLGSEAAWAPAVVHLSPSLTPRNPTPHMPGFRLYEFRSPSSSAAAWSGGGGGGADLLAIHEHSFDLDQSNAIGQPVWRNTSLSADLHLSSLQYNGWREWALKLVADDYAFADHMPAQRCADEIDSAFDVCKASYLCAILEPEPEPYDACLKRVKAGAVVPPGWVAGVKRVP